MIFINKYKVIIMKINEETKIRKQGEISLITTIPKTFVKALNMNYNDILEWILDTETETLTLKVNNTKLNKSIKND